MREFFKGWLSVLLHFALGLAGCLVYVFFFKETTILPPILMKWRLTEAALLFIQIMPSLLVSSILIGYSVIFGLSGQNTVPRYSRIALRYLRDVFIILFFCITAYLLLKEIVSPALLKYRHYGVLKTHDYYDFLQEAAVSLKNNRYEEAYYKLKSSIGIWPDSKEANELLDTAKIKMEEDVHHAVMSNTGSNNSIGYADNLTTEQALAIGRQSMANHDFYTAHLYAMRAYRLSPENSSYAEESMRLASQAWNQIEKGAAELKEEFDVKLYRSKKLGYELLQQGNFVKAYYQFVATQKMIEKYAPSQNDPDVNRFVELTRQKLLEEVFFIDEIETFSVFESIRNVSFTVAKSGIRPETLIKIGGISFIAQKGLQGIYGRNSEITQYNSDGTIRLKYRVPFIKFIPFLDTDDQYKIRMQMQAVDRHHEDIILKPAPVDAVSSEASLSSSMLLPISYADFELIIAAAEGEKAMTLPELFTFYPKAADYGFSPHVYYREMLSRLSDVFLILILSVYMLILAWQFRIPPHLPFKARWIVIFPFLFYTASFFVETIRYGFRLLVTMLTDYIGGYTSLTVFAAFVLLFMGLSFSFFAQRADS